MYSIAGLNCWRVVCLTYKSCDIRQECIEDDAPSFLLLPKLNLFLSPLFFASDRWPEHQQSSFPMTNHGYTAGKNLRRAHIRFPHPSTYSRYYYEEETETFKTIDWKPFAMGQPSSQASNAIIFLTYGAFLCVKPHILLHTRGYADSKRSRNAGSRASMLRGTGEISRDRNSWRPIVHRRVRYNTLTSCS